MNGYLNPQDTYSHNTASASTSPLPLKPGQPLGAVSYKVAGDTAAYTLDDFLGKFCTTGFLVLKDDQIVFERYLQGRKASDGLLSASMSKTVFALLMGIAINDGKLALTDRIGAVMPDFKDSAFADATVEDVLRMSSGVALNNSFDPGADSDNRATNPIVSPRQDVREYLRRKKELAAEAGTAFKYNGAQTALLGALMSQQVGPSLTAYLQDKVWVPMGAESRAYWIKNYRGEEGVQGQFVATLRDYARLGYLVMKQGSINGKEIVPASWIAKMTELRKDKPQPPNPPFYGLHIWIPQAAAGRAMFWGTNGQNIFIDPIARVVIVHTGNSPKAEFDGNRHLFPLRDAIVRSLAGAQQINVKTE
ncbi:serine hydrolase [Undibacterium sp.]|uniref:serine hydrolase domain-containing protein n=1 Tax=Undibacterium sp. TaxID=1914977 RepID=UPI002B559AF4|nr:serine hydrolase [Undibacterium sp.]HTD04717.1 serine hydrolase [Undibacterium sp.]